MCWQDVVKYMPCGHIRYLIGEQHFEKCYNFPCIGLRERVKRVEGNEKCVKCMGVDMEEWRRRGSLWIGRIFGL